MAYIKKEEESEQEGINQSMGQTGNDMETPQLVSGSSLSTNTQPTTAASTGMSTTPSNEPSPQASSGLYTNLQDYMEQNKPAAQGIATGVVDKTETQAQQIGKQVESQKSDFMNKVAENRARLQQAGTQAQQMIDQAGQQEFDPNAFQQTQQLATGQYQMEAPEFDIQEYQKQAESLARPAEMGQTQQGRRELLTQVFRGPEQNYTSGQRSLDELVLAGDAEARRRVAEEPLAKVQGIQQNITGAREQALSEIAGLGTERETLQSQIADRINQEQAAMRQQLEERAAFGQNVDQFTQGNITPELLEALNLEGGRLYGIDPETYLRGASSSQLATTEDLARARALQDLEMSQAGLAEAGIADASVVGAQDAFGIQALRDAVSRGRGEFQSKYDAETERRNKLENLDTYVRDLVASGEYDSSSESAPYLYSEAGLANQIEDYLSGVGLSGYNSSDLGRQYANYFSDAASNLTGPYDSRQDQLRNLEANTGYVQPLKTKVDDIIKNLQSQYGNVLTPSGIGQMGFVAADGGTKKNPRKEALRKLLGR